MLQTMKIELSEPLQNSLIAFSTALNYCKKNISLLTARDQMSLRVKEPILLAFIPGSGHDIPPLSGATYLWFLEYLSCSAFRYSTNN